MTEEKKKRVCAIHHTGEMGGGSRSFIDILQMLNDAYDVIACIPKGADQLKKMISDCGIEVYEIVSTIPKLRRYSGATSVISGGFIKDLISLRYKKQFAQEIMCLKPDVVIYNAIVTCLSAPFFPKTVQQICFVRETIVNRISGKLFSNCLEEHVDAVCFLAECEKNKMGLMKPRTIVIPDSFPTDKVKVFSKGEARKTLGLSENDYIMLFMGGFSRIKGIINIFKALNELPEQTKLLVAGDFKMEYISLNNIIKHITSINYSLYAMRVRKAYNSIENKDRVKFLGFVDNISTIFSASDVIVFPSAQVHQPRPCIEAGFYRKPVIISDFEETRENFEDGINAVCFKPNDYRDLARKIVSIMNDPCKSQQLGDNNYMMSVERHSYEQTKINLQQFLLDVIG